jgi:glutamine cyclotransferase
MKKTFEIFFIFSFIFLLSLNSTKSFLEKEISSTKNIKKYSYEIIKKYPHGSNRFTEGLVLDDNYLYESIGLFKKSNLLKIDLKKNKVILKHKLKSNIFAEGITVIDDKLYQLSYIQNHIFIYDKNSFELLSTNQISSQGWGLTTDKKNLILSDGSSCIKFVNKDTFQIEKEIFVHNQNINIGYINELEYIDNKIYANVFQTDYIIIINPDNGSIIGFIDCSNLESHKNPENVLNGIAFDQKTSNLFITGKNYKYIYEIKLILKD